MKKSNDEFLHTWIGDYQEVWPLKFHEVPNSGDRPGVKNLFSEFQIAVALILLEKKASANKVL